MDKAFSILVEGAACRTPHDAAAVASTVSSSVAACAVALVDPAAASLIDAAGAESFMRCGRALLRGRWLRRSPPESVGAAIAALHEVLSRRFAGGAAAGAAPTPLVVLVEMAHAAALAEADPLATALSLSAACAVVDGAPRLGALIVASGPAMLDPDSSGLALLGPAMLSTVRFAAARCSVALSARDRARPWPAAVLELVRRSLEHDVLCPLLLWAPNAGWPNDSPAAPLSRHLATRLAVAPLWTRELLQQLQMRRNRRNLDDALVAHCIAGALDSARGLHRGCLHARAAWVGVGPADPGAQAVEAALRQLMGTAFLAHTLLLHELLCCGGGGGGISSESVADAARTLAFVAWGRGGGAIPQLGAVTAALDAAAASKPDALARLAASLDEEGESPFHVRHRSDAASAIVAARLAAVCAMLARWGAAHRGSRAVGAVALPRLHRLARWGAPQLLAPPASGSAASAALVRQHAHLALRALLGLAGSGRSNHAAGDAPVDAVQLVGYAHLCAEAHPAHLSATALATAIGNVLDALDVTSEAARVRGDGVARSAALAGAVASIDVLCGALRGRLAQRELEHTVAEHESSPCRDLALVLFHSLKHVPLSTLPVAWGRCTALTRDVTPPARNALIELMRHAVVHSGGATQAHKEWLLPQFVQLHGEGWEQQQVPAHY